MAPAVQVFHSHNHIIITEIRDESFITRWRGGGSRLYSGGWVGVFGDGGGVKTKSPWGKGGHIFHQVFGRGAGSDVFHWLLLSLKVKVAPPPQQTPNIPNDTANNIKYSIN